MARLTCTRSGWGSVKDPETDEYVRLDSEVDQEVALRLADEYEPLTAILDESDDDEPEAFTCTGNGGECSRSVDEKGGRCWQHPKDD